MKWVVVRGVGALVKWVVALGAMGCSAPAPARVEIARASDVEIARASDTHVEVDAGGAQVADAGVFRRRRAVPAEVKLDPTAYACRQPLRSYCRRAPCASLDDFRDVLDCRQMPLQRCGGYRLLAQISALSGWVAAFDEQGVLVSGVRWTDSGDFCGGTQRAAYYGRALDCTPEDVFEPWCE